MGMPKGYIVAKNPKCNVVSTRLTADEAVMLNEVAEAKNVTKAEVLSMGIELQYYTLLRKRKKAKGNGV